MTDQLIRVEEQFDGQVLEIVIATAPANILSANVMTQISVVLEKSQAEKNRKLIVISGEGKHFSFGASVEEHQPDQVGSMLPQFHKFIGQIVDSKIPTMAKLKGCCLGGGFEVAMATTFCFADESLKGGVPEIQLAVFPPVAAALLPIKLAESHASQIILSGDNFTGAELKEFGLIQKLSKPGELDQDVNAFIEKTILPKSASSLRFAHQASRMVLSDHYAKFIGRLEDLYLKQLMATKDAVEGISAFVEKRKPEWTNQ